MPDVIPLRDLSRRFPKPKQQSDILLAYPLVGHSQEEIFRLLTDPQSEHWRHKYDWKSYMYLLAVDDWVFKTSEWHCSEDLQSVKLRIEIWKERGLKLKIWHPKKYWFILHQGDSYWACNATPRLVTLPEIRISLPEMSTLDQFELMLRWGAISIWVLMRYGLMLDYKAGNFAVSKGNKKLYYVDDEIYRFDSWQDFFRIKRQLLS